MTVQTKIEWTDFTVNFWEGCQKVGPGCDHCYAEARDKRFTGGEHWGAGAPRRKVKSGLSNLRKINREAKDFRAEHGRWPRVFCSSLSDVFDNAVDPTWRQEGFEGLEAAPNTRVQLLTKRVGNVERMIRASWRNDWPAHVGLMITVVNQKEAERDILKLIDLKIRFGIPWVGLSLEPMLGPISLRWLSAFPENAPHTAQMGPEGTNEYDGARRIDWVICGGESGHKARAMHPDWARQLRDQCAAAGVPFFFKQWGEWLPAEFHAAPDIHFQNGDWMDANTLPDIEAEGGWTEDWVNDEFEGHCLFKRVGKKRAGRRLDGIEHSEFPGALS